jgi:RNA polymerase sigma factor (sigma-70 family)
MVGETPEAQNPANEPGLPTFSARTSYSSHMVETAPDPAPEDADRARVNLVAELFREHNESLVRFLAARMRSRQEAKEVAQEAYVRVLNLDKPGAVSFMRAFLFRTAANLAIDRMRSRERHQNLRDFALFDELRETPTPERVAVGAEEIAIVGRLLEQLQPKIRETFLLNRVQGLEPAEIAKQMGIAERTVRHYILQAFLHCRKGLDAAEANEDSSHG